MKKETRAAETAGPAWTDKATALPVYAVVALTLSFVWFSDLVEVSFESRGMSLLLNTLLVTGVSAWGAALALRGYLYSGLPAMLYAGCGLVAMGASFFVSSLSLGAVQGPNVAVTVHNLGVFCASFFHLAAALRAGQARVSKPDPSVFKAAAAYLAVLALTGLIWATAQYDLTPVFYIPGKGTTPVRQLVLTVSVAAMAVAAAFLIRQASRRGSLSLRCYGLGLVLIAMGIVDVSIAVPGSVLSWTGRLSQGLGHLYLLAAFMVAIRSAVKKGLDVREAAADYYLESEDHYRALVNALRAAVISLDPQGRVVLWNPQAEAISGYSYAEATRAAETADPAWTDKATALPVYAVVALTLSFLWVSDLVEVSFESRGMSLLLNTLLVTGVSAWGAALALRGYLYSGLPAMLYAGCGLVAMGSSFFVSSLSLGAVHGPNVAVTVHNLGVFCASFFHLAAALRAGQARVSKPDPSVFQAAAAYLAVLALTGLIWATAQYDLTPAFYIPGKGTTPVRQLVLTVSVAAMAVAAAFLIRQASRRGSLSLRCYGLGLVLIAMGHSRYFHCRSRKRSRLDRTPVPRPRSSLSSGGIHGCHPLGG